MGTIVIIYPTPPTNVSEAWRHPRLTSFRGPNKFRFRVLPLQFQTQSCMPCPFKRRETCAKMRVPIHVIISALFSSSSSSSSSLVTKACIYMILFFSFYFFLNKIKSFKSERGRKPGLFYKSLLARFFHNDLHWIKRCPLFLSPHSLYDHAATLSTLSFSLAFHMYISMVDLAL